MLPTGALMVAAIVLPWYWAIYSQHGWLYIKPFLLQDTLSRYPQPVWGPRRPIFFYLPVIAGDLFPWSLFLCFAILAITIPVIIKISRRVLKNKASVPPALAGELAILDPPAKTGGTDQSYVTDRLQPTGDKLPRACV